MHALRRPPNRGPCKCKVQVSIESCFFLLGAERPLALGRPPYTSTWSVWVVRWCCSQARELERRYRDESRSGCRFVSRHFSEIVGADSRRPAGVKTTNVGGSQWKVRPADSSFASTSRFILETLSGDHWRREADSCRDTCSEIIGADSRSESRRGRW